MKTFRSENDARVKLWGSTFRGQYSLCKIFWLINIRGTNYFHHNLNDPQTTNYNDESETDYLFKMYQKRKSKIFSQRHITKLINPYFPRFFPQIFLPGYGTAFQ